MANRNPYELERRLSEAKERSRRSDLRGRPVLPELGTLGDVPPDLRGDTLREADPVTWRQWLANTIAGGISAGPPDAYDRRVAALLTGTQVPGTGIDEGGGIGPVDFVPGVGGGLGAAETKEAYDRGDWLGTALGAVGMALPAAGKLGKKVAKVAMPALTKGDAPMVEKIFQHAEQVRTPDYPMATEPVFEKADPALTKELVPQRSIAGELPPMPDPSKKLPLNDRSRPILENTEQIGAKLADYLLSSPNEPLPFYSTGTVLQGLIDRAGMSPEGARKQLFDWAGQGAATSPRTKTPPNLRNASYLLWRGAQGDPLQTEAQWAAEGNRIGFPLIGRQHVPLAEAFRTGTADPWKNPKPFTFRENWTGNMSDVTADTHNIRAILDAYDELFPGTLSREWFRTGAEGQAEFNRYREAGGFPKEGQLPPTADTLEGSMQPGSRFAQTEYPIMQGPTIEAARRLNISPAEAQERLWFERGPRTGLRSPSMTIPDLLNAQFEQTAKVLGISPEQVMKLWAQRRIPLASNEPISDVPGASAVG